MKKSKRILKIILRIFLVLFILMAICVGLFLIMRAVGKNNLYNKAKSKSPDLSGFASGEVQEEAVEEDEDWQEGDIRYQGKKYRYNQDILTFLLMGIDDMDQVPDPASVKDYTKGGQSDVLFLLVLNPHTKEISLVAVNRDTMTEINVYDKKNNFVSTVTAQLTLQHGYGDGGELSCKRTVEAVSNLFYQLPIHGYCAINMGAIPLMNDAVGGVEVELLEAIPNGSAAMKNKVGQKVTLKGKDAFWYLKYRDTTVFDSAGTRLTRQKQYMNAFVAEAKKKTGEDITFPVSLYNTLSDYMVTDISVSEVSYLASEVLGYTFHSEQIYSLEGEKVQGETFEEFYVNEQALYELILQLFYEPVDD